jgi:ubiquinone/menaquinone biosynthesis C-methylase UbiE
MIDRVPHHPSVRTQLGSAEAIPHPDDYFDAVVISDALHHFRDPAKAVRELRRVVRPGGGVTVLELDVRGWRRLLAVAERLVGEPAHFYTPETLMAEHGIAGATRSRGWAYVFQGEVAD